MNRWIANLSEARKIPVNVVDDREASRFIVPAIIDRDPVLVAISTAGTSPVLARRLRERLEALIPKRLGELASWLRALRAGTRRQLRDAGARRRFFEAVVDGPAARRFIEGDSRGARRSAQQLLATTSTAPRAAGEVTLVGAGPGDPELLTFKALRALQDADVILHDRLVPAAVLDMATARCRTDLRGQGRRQHRQHAGRNQRSADRACESRQARGAPEGRRPLRLRARRRRTGGAGGGANRFLRGARHHRRLRGRRLRGHSADASRLCARA